MSELLLKIGNSSQYEDGDILCAFNSRRIKLVHAQHICHPNNFGFNSAGLRHRGNLTDFFLSKVHKYKFVRVSVNEIKRINLETEEEDFLSHKPNNRNEYIHVAEHIKIVKQSPNHKIFGEDGSEYWYGGTITIPDINIAAIWNEIETKTPNREISHRKWPLKDVEKKHFLALSVNDFNDVTSAEIVSSELDDNNAVVQNRKYKVNWRAIPALSLSSGDIDNMDVTVDVRNDFQLVLNDIYEAKVAIAAAKVKK